MIKKIFSKIKDIYYWVGTDGILHYLSCYSITLTAEPVVEALWASIIALVIGLLKEVYDYFIKKNCDLNAVSHDIICDCGGIVSAVIVSLIL